MTWVQGILLIYKHKGRGPAAQDLRAQLKGYQCDKARVPVS